MRFMIEVITTKRDNPDHVVERRKINFNNSRQRAWLGRHSNWALRNGMAIHTAAAPDGPLPA
jgi:hypothetical protein